MGSTIALHARLGQNVHGSMGVGPVARICTRPYGRGERTPAQWAN